MIWYELKHAFIVTFSTKYLEPRNIKIVCLYISIYFSSHFDFIP